MILLIILITIFISFRGFTQPHFIEKYKFSPFRIDQFKEHHRWITGGFLHADMTHLFFNLFTLYSTSAILGYLYSSYEIVFFYLSAIVVSGIPDFFTYRKNPYYSAIGASGAVSAALFSLLIFDPWTKITLFFVIPIPFIIFAVLYLYYSYYMSKKNADNIGHRAHITGAVYGILFAAIKSPEQFGNFLQSLTNPPSLSRIIGL